MATSTSAKCPEDHDCSRDVIGCCFCPNCGEKLQGTSGPPACAAIADFHEFAAGFNCVFCPSCGQKIELAEV